MYCILEFELKFILQHNQTFQFSTLQLLFSFNLYIFLCILCSKTRLQTKHHLFGVMNSYGENASFIQVLIQISNESFLIREKSWHINLWLFHSQVLTKIIVKLKSNTQDEFKLHEIGNCAQKISVQSYQLYLQQ